MKLTPKKISLSENVKLQPSSVFSEIRLDLHPWVHVVSTQSLWEKLVTWPRCISGQYVGKVGEKAWKMPWEPSGRSLGDLWEPWDWDGGQDGTSSDRGWFYLSMAEQRREKIEFPRNQKGRDDWDQLLRHLVFQGHVASVGLEKHI